MNALLFSVALVAAPHGAAASQASSQDSAQISESTRPELFRDAPPDRGPAAFVTPPESSFSFWATMLLRTTLVLAAVVALAYLLLGKGLARLLRVGPVGSGRLVTLIERLPLDPKHALFLIEADGRRFLIATAEHTTGLVAELGGLQRPTVKEDA